MAPTIIDPSGDTSGSGLNQKAKVAVGVVVPIVAIAVIAIIALFFWKRRRANKRDEEERRKEVEDYSYNPNNDPSPIPRATPSENAYEMREDGSSAGYRGWGTTTLAGGSNGRKASTTMSGGGVTDPTSQGRGAYSDRQAGQSEPLMNGDGEILGAMGPNTNNNRGADVHRGASNASSSYSAAGRSEGSDGGMYGNQGGYYEQYGQNPYSDNPQPTGGQPVIRDNPARRNTRIENPAHYPQQSAGISQNF